MKKSKKSISKLFELLKLLTGRQRKDIKTFVTMSGNHLPKKEEVLVSVLLDAIGSNDKLNESDFLKDYLKEEKQVVWNKFKSKFLTVLENYILLEELNGKQLLKDICLAEYFAQTDAQKNYRGIVRRLRENMFKDKQKQEWHSLVEYRLSEIELEKSIEDRSGSDNLYLMSQLMDDFYIEQKLRILCELANRQSIINTRMTTSFLIQHLDREGVEALSSESKSYYFAIKLLTTQRDAYFDKIRSHIAQYEGFFSRDLLVTMYTLLLNYCSRQVNQGQHTYARHFLGIVDDQIHKKMLITESKITGGKFKNCVVNALIADRIDWGHFFISKFTRFLSDDVRLQVSSYCKSLLALHADKVEIAHEHIKLFSSDDLYFLIAYKKLLFKIYYNYFKVGEYDKRLLRDNINNLKKKINREGQLTEGRKKKNIRFLNCLLGLISGRSLKLDSLRRKVPASDFIWLKKETSH